MKKLSTILTILISNNVLADQVTATLNNTAKKGQMLALAALPLFVITIGYLYQRGKPEAKDRMENFVIGSILVVAAFGVSSYFRR